jgi:hypothetical protein
VQIAHATNEMWSAAAAVIVKGNPRGEEFSSSSTDTHTQSETFSTGQIRLLCKYAARTHIKESEMKSYLVGGAAAHMRLGEQNKKKSERCPRVIYYYLSVRSFLRIDLWNSPNAIPPPLLDANSHFLPVIQIV